MERGARPARPHRRPLFCRAECQEQVNKFPSASFKKFATEKDAWSFVRAGLPGLQQPEPAGSASRRPAGRRGGKEGGRAGGCASAAAAAGTRHRPLFIHRHWPEDTAMGDVPVQ